jgi:hypothetical protein
MNAITVKLIEATQALRLSVKIQVVRLSLSALSCLPGSQS